MKKFLIVLLFSGCLFGKIINVTSSENEAHIIANHQAHVEYGLSYPVTYMFDIPEDAQDFNAYRKYNRADDWNLIDEKTSADYFNGIEVVRFDYEENIAYVSVGFSGISDTIFIQLENNNNESIPPSFINTCEYYDNRRSVVTITADDWADYCNEKFIQACQNFRSFRLWYSVAIITGWIEGLDTWNDIQAQIDSGYVEPLAHSRNHPYVPYIDAESEVLGSKQDILNNLNLLNHNRSGENEYVYAWVAPYGDYDETIDTLTSIGRYLISRLFYYNENYFSSWDSNLNKFDPVGGSIELGSSNYWGSTDINELNNIFENTFNSNEIYHLITHPNILDWDEDFIWEHLEYISNRKDVWYVGFGHLYLYHFLTETDEWLHLKINENKSLPHPNMIIYPNYPNPFNPSTTLRYNLLENSFVKVTVYDMLGKVAKELVNDYQTSGYNSIQWDATNSHGDPVSGGVYIFNIESDRFNQTTKVLFLK